MLASVLYVLVDHAMASVLTGIPFEKLVDPATIGETTAGVISIAIWGAT